MRRHTYDTPIQAGTRWIAAMTSFSILWSAVAGPAAEASIWTERKNAVQRARQIDGSSVTTVNVRDSFRPAGTQRMRVPEELGTVIEQWPAGEIPQATAEKPLIIHIQDAHGMYGAQKNAIALLNWIDDERAQRGESETEPLLVCVEGAWTQANPDWLSAYPDKAVKKQVADYLLESSQIAGEEYLAILENPGKLDIEGVEDRDLYLSNLASRQMIDRKRGEILAAYREFQERLRKVELKIGGNALVQYGERAADFAEHKLGAREYFTYLNALAPGWSAEDYPNLALFKRAIDSETSLPASRVEAQREELMRTFSRRLGSAELSALAKVSVDYRLGLLSSADFHQGLVKIAEQLDLSAPILAAHVENLRLHDSIDFSELNAEIEGLEKAAGRALIRKLGREERIVDLAKLLREQIRFWGEKLTPAGYGEFRQISKMSWVEIDEILRNLENKYSVQTEDGRRAASSFSDVRYIQEAYYKLALKRDQSMASRALEKAREKNASVAVLIAGGFHSAGMTELLKKEGVPHIVIQPRLNRSEPGAKALSSAEPASQGIETYQKNLADYARSLAEIANRPDKRSSKHPGDHPGAISRDAARQALDLIRNQPALSRGYERGGKTYAFSSYLDGGARKSVVMEFSPRGASPDFNSARSGRNPLAQKDMLREAALMSGAQPGRLPVLTLSLLSQAAIGGAQDLSGLTADNVEEFLTRAPFTLAVTNGTDLEKLKAAVQNELSGVFAGSIGWKIQSREEQNRTVLEITFIKNNSHAASAAASKTAFTPDAPRAGPAQRKPASVFGRWQGLVTNAFRAVAVLVIVGVGMHFMAPQASAHYFNEQGAVVETWTWDEPAQNTLLQIEIDALTQSGLEVNAENLAKIRQQIYELNPGLSDHPGLIYPGQQIVIPQEYLPAAATPDADVTPIPGDATPVPGTQVPNGTLPGDGTQVPGTPTPAPSLTPTPSVTPTPSPVSETQTPTPAASLTPTPGTSAQTESKDKSLLPDWKTMALIAAGAAVAGYIAYRLTRAAKPVLDGVASRTRSLAGGRVARGIQWAGRGIWRGSAQIGSSLKNMRLVSSMALVTVISIAEEWIFRSEVFGRGFDWTNSLLGATGLAGTPLSAATWGTALLLSIPGFALYHVVLNKIVGRIFPHIYDRSETLKANFKFRMPVAVVLVFLFLQFPAVSVLGAEAHWNVIAHVAYNLLAYPLGRALLCGNIGLLQARKSGETEIVPAQVMRVLNRMGSVTKIRGEQAAGMTVFARDDSGRGKAITTRIVNPKRLNLPDQLESAVKSKLTKSFRSTTKPSEDTLMIVGHYRYGTSSAPDEKETHPHQWMPERTARVWTLNNGRYTAENKKVASIITHNGDFDYWNIFGEEQPNDRIGMWLERVLHTPNNTKGDSPKIAGMMDLLLTQGMWDASARLAYQLTVATSLQDAFGGEEPSKTAPNHAPSNAQLQKWGEIFEKAFEPRKNILAHRPAEDWRALAREVTRELEKDGAARNWTAEQRSNFASSAVEAFRENDLYRSTQKFMAGAVGTFGLATSTTLEGDHVILSARGQPISIGIDPDNQRLFYVSEPAALKVMLEESKGEVYRWDLDQKKGEILDLRLEGWRLYSEYLGREFTEDEIARSGRLIELKDNPYMSPLNEGVVNDPVGADIRDIPKALSHIREDWADADSLNRQTADAFVRKISDKIATHKNRRRGAVDLLITGIESSIWLGERFGEDLRRVFPDLNILPVSSNKLLEGNLGIDSETVVLAISQSGQTFPTLNALISLVEGQRSSREKNAEDPHNIFVMTGEMDSLLGLAVGQRYYRGAPFSRRIFTNGSGRRPAEPSTVAAASTHATLTELLLHLARTVRTEHPQGEPLGMTLTNAEIEELSRLQDELVRDHTAKIVGADAAGNEVKSDVHNELVQQGEKWGRHILDNARSFIAANIYILVTVIFAVPLFGTLLGASPIGIPFVDMRDSLGMAYGPVSRVPDALFYVFFSTLFIYGLRFTGKRIVFARNTARTVVIGDISSNHQLLESFVSKLFSLSYGHATLNVHGANPQDHMVHRFGHRITRGTLIFLGRPDGRTKALAGAESAVQMTGKQAKGVQNWGVGAEVVTVGQNPSFNPNAADKHIVLPESSRLTQPSDDLGRLFENRIDSAQRLISSYVFFHAMARKVSTFRPFRYDMSRSQSGTRVATTASPVSGASIFGSASQDESIELLAEPVVLPFTVKSTAKTVEPVEWEPEQQTVPEPETLEELAAAHRFSVRKSLEHIDFDVLKRRVQLLTQHGIRIAPAALTTRGFLNAIAAGGKRPNEVVTPNPEISARLAAERIAEVIRENNEKSRPTNLGTVVGEHARLVYRELGVIRQHTGLDFSNVHIFGMEALTQPHSAAEERRLFIEFALSNQLNIPSAHRHFLRTQSEVDGIGADLDLNALIARRQRPAARKPAKFDLKAEAARFEAEILARGGIDVQILDLTEPVSWSRSPSHFESRTKSYPAVVSGGERKQLFGMGGATALDAREIIALTDLENAPEFLKDAAPGNIEPSLPLSYLRIHPNISFYVSETSELRGSGSGMMFERLERTRERVQEAIHLSALAIAGLAAAAGSAVSGFFAGYTGGTSALSAGLSADNAASAINVSDIRQSLGDAPGRWDEAAEFNLPYSWGFSLTASQTAPVRKKEVFVLDLNATFQVKGREVFMSPAIRKFIMGAVEAARMRSSADDGRTTSFAIVLDPSGDAAKDPAMVAKLAESLGIEENTVDFVADNPGALMRDLKSQRREVALSVFTLSPDEWRRYAGDGIAIHPLLQLDKDVTITGDQAQRMRDILLARNETALDGSGVIWDAEKRELILKGQALANDLTVHFGRDAAIFEIQQ